VTAAPDQTPHSTPHRPIAVPPAVAVAVATYVAAALWINGGTIFSRSLFDYYSLLMDAVAHGHLWITGIQRLDDLATFHERTYIYWGPAPLLLIGPFYLAGHGWQQDVAYTLVIGCANLVVFAWMLREAGRALGRELSAGAAALTILLFAWATPNFYLSVQGRIWHTNQISATFFCLVSLAFLFRFLDRLRFRDLVLAAMAFNLAWITRMTYLAIGPIFLYAAWHARARRRPLGVRAIAVPAVVGAVAIAGWCAYNYARFGSVTETGYSYMNHSTRFLKGVRTHTMWGLQYLGYNAYYYFAHVPIDWASRRLAFDVEGNSILCLYPWTLLVAGVPFVWRTVPPAARPLLWVVTGIAAFQLAAELTFYSTGWTHLGARYFLDSVPLLFVMLVPVIRRTPGLLLGAAVLVGLVLNVLGMASFYGVSLP
jgi:hypothetical protein